MPKGKFASRPMDSPRMMERMRTTRDLEAIFTPKCAGLTEDQNFFLCSAYSGVSSAPGRPSGCSVTVDRVLFTTTVSAEGNFIAHIPRGL